MQNSSSNYDTAAHDCTPGESSATTGVCIHMRVWAVSVPQSRCKFGGFMDNKRVNMQIISEDLKYFKGLIVKKVIKEGSIL